MKSLVKVLKAAFVTLMAYLLQACVMQYFAIGGITGSVIFAALAILTVSLGKKYTFCASCVIGILISFFISVFSKNHIYTVSFGAPSCVRPRKTVPAFRSGPPSMKKYTTCRFSLL